MIHKADNDSVDTTIRDIHAIREKLSDQFGGDISAILEDARRRQEKSGRRIISRGELSKEISPETDDVN